MPKTAQLKRQLKRRNFWSIYSPMGTKIEKRFEKHVPVRLSSRSLVQSIREGLGFAELLGTKFKKKFENFFYDPLLSHLTVF